MGYKQGFKKGLKFANSSEIAFSDNHCIVEVNIYENNENDKYNKNENRDDKYENVKTIRMKMEINQRWGICMIKNNKK